MEQQMTRKSRLNLLFTSQPGQNVQKCSLLTAGAFLHPAKSSLVEADPEHSCFVLVFFHSPMGWDPQKLRFWKGNLLCKNLDEHGIAYLRAVLAAGVTHPAHSFFLTFFPFFSPFAKILCVNIIIYHCCSKNTLPL